MKTALYLLLLCARTFSCEQMPVKSLRELYGQDLGTLKELQKIGSTKMFMFNLAIAHDDLEAFKILLTQGNKIVYEKELLLSPWNKEKGWEPIFFFPLHLAAQCGSLNVANFCLSHGEDVNRLTVCNNPELDKNTAAHFAVRYGSHALLEILLRQKEINLSATNGQGKTILDLAQEKNDAHALALIQTARTRIQ